VLGAKAAATYEARAMYAKDWLGALATLANMKRHEAKHLIVISVLLVKLQARMLCEIKRRGKKR
jgi:hypothetical protein